MSNILYDLYSVKPISASQRLALTEKFSNDLSNWRLELARFLDVDQFSMSLFMPIFQRQRNVLNLTYWHAIILTHRPFVLSNFVGHLVQARTADDVSWQIQVDRSVQQCLTAAMKIVNTVDDIMRNQQFFRAFWVGPT